MATKKRSQKSGVRSQKKPGAGSQEPEGSKKKVASGQGPGVKKKKPEARSKESGAKGKDSALAVVRRELEQYAERGVFRSFSPISSSNGKTEFQFSWLWNKPFHLGFDEKRKTLTFRRLLPNLPVGSPIETGVRAFLESVASSERPEHRRLDPARVVIQYSNQRGTASLAFRVLDADFAHGVQRTMDIVNEVFLMFLGPRYPEYLVATFNLPED